ncbi:MAG: CARDB domain-containing protein [Solirubrobacteraceae bacterium]
MALAALALGAPGATAAVVGVGSDPSGDAADPHPGRDIVDFGISYDRRTGKMEGAVRLRGGAADAPSLVTLVAGRRTAGGCNGYPAVGFASATDDWGARWLRFQAPAGAGPRGDADKVGRGDAIQRFEATDRMLRGVRSDCVVAFLSQLDDGSVIYDTAGPLPLVPQPELGIRISGVPKRFAPDRRRRIRVTLSNPGEARTGRIRLRVGRARGLVVSPRTRTLPGLKAGGKRTVTLRVTLRARARTATTLKVTARAGKLRASDDASLYLRHRPRGGSGGGAGHVPRLCNRYSPDLSGRTGGSLILVPC